MDKRSQLSMGARSEEVSRRRGIGEKRLYFSLITWFGRRSWDLSRVEGLATRDKGRGSGTKPREVRGASASMVVGYRGFGREKGGVKKKDHTVGPTERGLSTADIKKRLEKNGIFKPALWEGRKFSQPKRRGAIRFCVSIRPD